MSHTTAREAVICEPLRTPVGRFGGVFRDVAASVLAVGSAARDSALRRGASQVRIFANTIDVERWAERADRLSPRPHEGVLVLSVGRDVQR